LRDDLEHGPEELKDLSEQRDSPQRLVDVHQAPLPFRETG
jgi:hypothetical protein